MYLRMYSCLLVYGTHCRTCRRTAHLQLAFCPTIYNVKMIKLTCLHPSIFTFIHGPAISRAEPGTRNLQKVLREIYVSYTDCALKDPFYELEMPIRCELFTQAVDDIMRRYD